MELKVTSLRIDRELWKKLRIQALKEDKTLSEMIERILANYLGELHE